MLPQRRQSKNKLTAANVTPPNPTCFATPASHTTRPTLSSIKVHNPTDYLGRAIIKQHSMALQQEHSPSRPKTKVDSYKDPSQVALSEDPNSIRFAKDPSKLVLFSLQYVDPTYNCLAQKQTQDDAHKGRGSCLAQQPP